MGFFFLENTVTLKQPTKQQRSIAALNKIGCAACTLNKTKVNTPKMKPTLADETWIYFLGEAPGEIEDKEGKPFIGPSGRLLRYCIPSDLIDHCSFDNIVRDRPPQNRDPTTTEVECCRQYVTKSIEQAKPKIIVGLGAHAQQWMLGSSDQFGMRGRVFAVKVGSHICWFMPTYHPARVLHSASEQAKRQGRGRHSNNDSYLVSTYYGRSFKLDIEKARTYINLPPPEFENESELRSKVLAVTDFETVCALLAKAKRSPTKALDIETSTLRPYSTGAAILSVAFSFNSTHFAFPLDHKLAKWTGSQRKQILDLLRDILIDDTIKVAHNCPFEVEWFIHYFGKGVVNHASWECTQLQAHFLDERRGAGQSNDDDSRRATYQSLDFLIRLHFGCSYKQSFKVDRKQIAYANLTETLLYNATDSRLTLKLWYRQRRLIEAEGLYNAYLAAIPRQPTTALMQYLGMPINQTTVKRLQGRLSAEIAVLEAEIDQLDVVKQFKRDRKEFHPMGNDAIIIFDKYLNRSEIKVQDGSRLRLSVDKRVLEKIDHPLAKLIVKLRNKRKMKSTYLDEFERGKGKLIYPDGKIHTNFHTTFTTTGRLASCVAPWTKVPVVGIGEIPISEVEIGDLVWTHKKRYKKVVAKHIKGVQPMLSVHLNNGTILTCTKDHRLLLSSQQWVTVGELNDVFKIMGIEQSKCGSSIKTLPQSRNAAGSRNSQAVGDQGQQCVVGDEEQTKPARIQSFKIPKVLSLKEGRKESYERKNRGIESSLERSLFRSERVPDNKTQWTAHILPSLYYNAGIRIESHPEGVGGAPHRWRSTQQSARQFSTSYTSWAHDYSLQGSGTDVIKIEKIETSGCYEVHDITIEDDSSYAALEVFHHNSDPNAQNWPQRADSWVREQVEAEDGCVIVAADYGQLEMCGAAMCSKDPYLVKVLWDDYDTHMFWASRLAAICPDRVGGDFNDPKVAKSFRSLVKNKLVFPAIYGATNTSIAGYLSMEVHHIDTLLDEFWDAFRGIKKWQDSLLRKYRETGYVEAPTGRRRNHPLTANEAINAPIQCLASEIVVEAMCRLSYIAATENKWYIHPRLNIHDDLSFIIPEKKLVSSIEAIYKTMLTPSIVTDFIPKEAQVPLSVTVSIGKDWYHREEVGKFWSHRDI